MPGCYCRENCESKATTALAASAPNGNPNKTADEIVTVRPLTSSTSKQRLKQFDG